jgi:hypothetical protein
MCQNHTLRVEIAFVHAEIIFVRVVIILVRVEIILRVEIALCAYKSHSTVS